jgi:hypothetical protein
MKKLYFELGRMYNALRKEGDGLSTDMYIKLVEERLIDFICYTIEEKHWEKWNCDTIADLAKIVRQVWNLVNYKNRHEPFYELVEKADSEIFHAIECEVF